MIRVENATVVGTLRRSFLLERLVVGTLRRSFLLERLVVGTLRRSFLPERLVVGQPRHGRDRLGALVLAFLVAAGVSLAMPRAPGPQAGTDRTRLSPADETICFVPLGEHDPYLLERAARGVTYLFGFKVATLPGREMPEKAYYPPRKRWRADSIVEYISSEIVPDSGCLAVIGFTELDISVTKGKHKDWGILGLGVLGGDAAVVSSYRMTRRRHRGKQPDRTIEAQRAVKVTNHELGHVLGLDHDNRKKGCLMNDAGGTIKTVDGESGILCDHERAALVKKYRVDVPVRDHMDWDQVLGDGRADR